MDASGRATDQEGATVSLRAEGAVAGAFGSAASGLSAGDLRGRRVTLSGELQTRGVTEGASLWLRVDRDATMLLLDNGVGRSLHGDVEWTPYSVTLPVFADATRVVFGVLLQGGGSVVARKVRFEAGAPLSPDRPLAEPAREVLDAAIRIVKENALQRNEIAWTVVEPRVRAYTAGSQTSAEVYPAIRYLLSELGDHHSFLLPPSGVTAMGAGDVTNQIPRFVRVVLESATLACRATWDGNLRRCAPTPIDSIVCSATRKVRQRADGLWTSVTTAAGTCGQCWPD